MFRTPLHVAHIDSKDWRLTQPLVWEGQWEYMIIRSGFVTDFASIPKPVRWLLDNAGRNSEAAVLHDAVWRESKRGPDARVDPWHADGIFRRTLRETGSTALARGLMWFAVRAAAMAKGRLGRLGPSLAVKVLQLLAILVLGVVTALVPTIIAVLGLFVYWLASWVVAVVWHFAYERAHFEQPTNWPWPANKRPRRPADPIARELLVIIEKGPSPDGRPGSEGKSEEHERAERLAAMLAAGRPVTEADVDLVVGQP